MSLNLEVKNHILTFRSDRPILYVTERKAKIIRKALNDRGIKFFDLTDDDGNYCETIRVLDVYGLKTVGAYNDGDNSKNRWICQHGRRQKMSQGCYNDPLGERQWSGQYCTCPTAPKAPQ